MLEQLQKLLKEAQERNWHTVAITQEQLKAIISALDPRKEEYKPYNWSSMKAWYDSFMDG